MKVENLLNVIVGIFVFTSAALGFWVNKYWLLFTIFVGLNLFQFGFTKFCLLEKILRKILKE